MIILMGLAGSGKSTQGRRLAEATGRIWLSAGEILRETGDPEVKAILETGKLVPNELIERLMVERILEVVREGKDVVVDGFPREMEQAKWMVEKNLTAAVKMVIVIEVPREELWRRLEARGRADDTAEAIRERMRLGEENLRGICKILEGAGVRIEKVDGVGEVDKIFEQIMDLLSRRSAAPEEAENE